MRIAVIGSGISSASFFYHMPRNDTKIVIFDKARGIGGRMSRRVIPGVGEFDHGAQFFTARDPRFLRAIEPLIEKGVVKTWDANLVYFANQQKLPAKASRRFVACPANALVKELLKDATVHLNAKIVALSRSAATWTLHMEDGSQHSGFNTVVLSVPPPQAKELVGAYWKPQQIEAVMDPCFCLLVGLRRGSWRESWQGAFLKDGAISFMAMNGSKGRPGEAECLTVHAGVEFSSRYTPENRQSMEKELLEKLQLQVGIRDSDVMHVSSHFWRYAKPKVELPSEKGYEFDSKLGLSLVGDYLMGGRVEGAFLSGLRLAENF